MNQTLRSTSRTAGLTLLELTIYVALVAVLSVPLISIVLVSTRSVAEADAVTRLHERNRTTLFQLRREIRLALRDTLDVDVGGTLRFTLPGEYDGVGPVPGDRIAYSFEKRPDFPAYGNVLPGRLVRSNESSGESRVVTSELDLARSSFVRDGDTLHIELTHAKKADDADAALFSIVRSLKVRPRN